MQGYKLEAGSPQGATCIAGDWSPAIAAAGAGRGGQGGGGAWIRGVVCRPEFHPRIRHICTVTPYYIAFVNFLWMIY